jgi:16S rRNA (uracil1498-N3)-methyltransferase
VQTKDSPVVLTIDEIHQHAPPPVQMTLAQGVIKGQRMDLLLQKTAELGIAAIIPLACEHAVVKMDGKRAEKQHARWSRILLNAMKQSGNPWLPRLEAPLSVADYVQRSAALRLYGALDRDAEPLAVAVERSLKGGSNPRVDIVIGPEGDFSKSEYEALRSSGAVAVDLGDCVLRSETAALYVISVVHAQCYGKR